MSNEFQPSEAFVKLLETLDGSMTTNILNRTRVPREFHRAITDIDGIDLMASGTPTVDEILARVQSWGFSIFEARRQIDQLLENHVSQEYDVFMSDRIPPDPIGVVFIMMKESFDER